MAKSKNLINHKYGHKCIVKEKTNKQNISREYYWIVECGCGTLFETVTSNITGKTKKEHCGCKSKKNINLVNKDHFHSKIIRFSHYKNQQKVWELECKCGQLYYATTGEINIYRKKSCGCLNKKGNRGQNSNGTRKFKINWLGYKFGDFTITKHLRGVHGHNRWWEITCNTCGNKGKICSSDIFKEKRSDCKCKKIIETLQKNNNQSKYQFHKKYNYNLIVTLKCKCGTIYDITFNRIKEGAGQNCSLCSTQKRRQPRKNLKFIDYIADSAKKRNYSFNISNDDLIKLLKKQNNKCALTGLSIDIDLNLKTGGRNRTASLDRIDNNKGYVKNNIQWVHKKINIIKHTLSMEDFYKICKMVVENLKNAYN